MKKESLRKVIRKRDIDEFLEIRRKTRNYVVIVEGKNDLVVMKQLGYEKVLTLNKPIYELVEQLMERKEKVMILTDMDKQGKRLFSTLKRELNNNGVMIDNSLREFLFRKGFSTIEGLTKLIEILKNSYYF